MNYDDLLSSLGNFSAYQLRNYILLCIPIILCAFHKLSSVFILAKMDFRCRLPGEDANSTFKFSDNDTLQLAILNASYPHSDNDGFSKCHYYTDNYFSPEIDNHEVRECTQYVWDTSKFQSSALQTFELVCDRGHFKAMSDSLFMIGVFIGSFGFGHLSDKYGRRKIFVVSLILQLIFGLLVSVSTDFLTFTIFRMIVGATTSGVFLVAYCLSLEMVGKDFRMQAGMFFMCFFSIGYMIMGLIAFVITDWRIYQAVITIPGIFFLFYWWFIPESVRWLMANNRMHKAIKLIEKIARANNKELPKELVDKFIETEMNAENTDPNEPKPSVLDLFRQPHLRTKALLIFFDWFVVSMSYYGLSWSSSDLVGDPRWNHVLSGFVELPGYVILLNTLNRFGRKKVLAANLTFAGCMLLLSLVVPSESGWLINTLTMLGKMSITASYGTIYLFSVEQFPTVIRNVALGCCSMSARIGATISPFLIYLSVTWQPLPVLIFGITAFMGGFFSTFLPETYKTNLPDSLADAAVIGKNTNHEGIKDDEFVVLGDIADNENKQDK